MTMTKGVIILDGNQITDVHEDAFVNGPQGTFWQLKMESNQIPNLDFKVKFMVFDVGCTLKMADNNIGPISGPILMGTGTENLHILDFSENPIMTISGDAFTHIADMMSIKMDTCQLEGIPVELFAGNTKLEDISLEENFIPEFTRAHTENIVDLHELDLADNRLTEIEAGFAAGQEGLQVLKLNKN